MATMKWAARHSAQTILLVMLSAIFVCAQAYGQQQPESLVPTKTALELIATDGAGWVQGQQIANPDNYNLEFSALPGAVIKRVFEQNTVNLKGAPLGIGTALKLRDELNMALGPRTALLLAREQQQRRDLASSLLFARETRIMALTQGFGSGETAGTLSMQREETYSRVARGQYERLTTQMMGLNTGLGRGFNLGMAFKQQDSDDPFGLHRKEMSGSLAVPMAGRSGTIAFATTSQNKGITHEETTKTDLVAPLQLFGGAAAFEHHITTNIKDAARAEVKTTKFSSPLPYRGAKFSGQLTTWHHNQAAGLQGRDVAGNLAMPAFGNQWTFAYSKFYQTQGNHLTRKAGLDIVMPLPLFGDQAKFERHLNFGGKDGAWNLDRTTRIVLPLTGLKRGASLDYVNTRKMKPGKGDIENRTTHFLLPLEELQKGAKFEIVDTAKRKNADVVRERTSKFFTPLDNVHKGTSLEWVLFTTQHGTGPTREARTLTIAMPVSFFGSPGNTSYKLIRTRQGGMYQTQDIINVSTRMSGETLSLEQKYIDTFNEGSAVRETVTFIKSPEFMLFTPKATISANQLRHEWSSGKVNTTTNVALAAHIWDPLSLRANYRIADASGTRTEVTKIYTEYTLSKLLNFGAHMEATSPENMAATIRRHIFLRKARGGDSGLELKAGLTTWSRPGAEIAPAASIQASLGNPKSVGLSAQYVEYDPKKWVPLQEPTVSLALEHQEPSGLSLKLEYSDSQKRAALYRGLRIAMPALGGNFSFGFGENPIEGKKIRPAKLYDLGLQRPAGGKPERGGQIKLAYMSGDFVPRPNPKKAPPSSIFSVEYSKQWTDTGRLTLSVHRATPPVSQPHADETMEGRLEYEARFW